MTVRARLIPLDSKRDDDNRRAGSLTIYFSQRTHDVVAAYCLAMAEARVRFPLGALHLGVWESLGIPPVSGTGDRWFKSNYAD